MTTQQAFDFESNAATPSTPTPTAPAAPTPEPLTLPSRPAEPGPATSATQKAPVSLTGSSWEEKQAKAQDVTDKALATLSEALAAGHSEGLKAYLLTMAKFHTYSFGNQLLIALQRPDATHVAGFNAWKKFGRSVKKGEAGIMVMAPVTRRIGEVENVQADGSKSREEIRRIVNVKPVYVFDVSQTDGKPLPEFARIGGDPAESTAKLKDLVKARGIELLFARSLGGALGVSEGGRIQILEGMPPASEFHVLAHELAHELLHRDERRTATTKKVRETEAEAVAFVVCTAIGLDAKDNSADYISLYRGDAQTLAESLQHIQRVASDIIAVLTTE